MSYVPQAGPFYKTTLYKTRLIDLQSDFETSYSKRLWYHFRKSEEARITIDRPESIPDLREMYEPIQKSKGLNPLHPEALQIKDDYHYSVANHPVLGRLAAHLTIGDREEGRAYQFINASAYRTLATNADKQLCSSANKYLYYQDMLYFRSLGFRHFDFVGTMEPINQFKKQFGGEIVETYNHVPYVIYALKKLWKSR